MDPIFLAWLRAQLGPTTDEQDLAVRYARLGRAREVAAEVLSERRAALLAEPLRMTVDGVVTIDQTNNLTGWSARSPPSRTWSHQTTPRREKRAPTSSQPRFCRHGERGRATMPYEWPPLVPGDPEEISRRVAAVLEDAWQRLAAKQHEVIVQFAGNPRTPDTVADLEEFKQAIRDFHRRVDQEAWQFAQRQLTHLYEKGGRQAAEAMGMTFTWTTFHRDALQSLAADSYADFLRRSEEAERMAGQFYRAARQAARREVPLLTAGNMTAKQAAKNLADRLAAEHKLTYVVYRNGARVPVRAWAEAAALAKVRSPTTPAPSTGPASRASSTWRYSTGLGVAGPATRTLPKRAGPCVRSRRQPTGLFRTRGAAGLSARAFTQAHPGR
ncbi:hypothetical protein [Streptomyces sp. HF10]|uniref:hypothetical protein n=1 Tax=Streptomyces sp. HF10 TaxID=2692233 RepID=UPI001F2FBB88|nr:hypothetical protein [Streptomyces sp. HF10]